MGGYGAVTLALRFPELFRAAASHSGVLAPRLLPAAAPGGRAGTAGRLPEFRAAARSLWPSQRIAFGTDSIAWWARDPATLATRMVARAAAGQGPLPSLRLDCGVDDPWIAHNRAFRDTLRQLGVAHEYVEAPGAHTWSYWRTHAAESLRFLLTHVSVP
jgi:S-formylglutathione hydrolase FrmB